MTARRLLAVALCCAATLLVAVACCREAAPPAPLTVGTNTWPGYEPLYLAAQIGALSPRVARISRQPSATHVMEEFKAGRIDAAGLTLDEAMLLLDQGAEPRVVLVMDISNGADALLAHANITSPADLKGRRIGVEDTALGAYLLARALEAAGLNMTDVEVVHEEINAQAAAFHSGNVDAVITFEPTRSTLLNAGAVELFNSREIPGEVVDVLVVREKVLRAHRDQVADLIRAWFAAVDFLAEKPAQAARVIAANTHGTSAQVMAAYDLLHLPGRDENVRLLIGGAEMPTLAATAARLHRVMRANRLIGPSLDAPRILSVQRHDHPLPLALTP